MKAVTIAGISLIIIGIIILILPKEEMARGFIGLFFAYPLIILGILLLFSIVGASLFFIGLILIISLITTITKFAANLYWLIWVGYGLYVIGILYGLAEGIIKLVKFLKKKK